MHNQLQLNHTFSPAHSEMLYNFVLLRNFALWEAPEFILMQVYLVKHAQPSEIGVNKQVSMSYFIWKNKQQLPKELLI